MKGIRGMKDVSKARSVDLFSPLICSWDSAGTLSPGSVPLRCVTSGLTHGGADISTRQLQDQTLPAVHLLPPVPGKVPASYFPCVAGREQMPPPILCLAKGRVEGR